MANIEVKTLIRAKENDSKVTQQLRRLQQLGWVVVDKQIQYSENNAIEYITLNRDLDDPRNVHFKEIQDDEEDLQRAIDYCNSYMDYCEYMADELQKSKKFKPLLFIIFILYGLFQIGGGIALGFLGMKGMIPVEADNIDAAGDFYLPEGVSIFGVDHFNIWWAIIIVCAVVGGAALLAAILLLIRKLTMRKIINEQIEGYYDKRDQFAALLRSLNNKGTQSNRDLEDDYVLDYSEKKIKR